MSQLLKFELETSSIFSLFLQKCIEDIRENIISTHLYTIRTDRNLRIQTCIFTRLPDILKDLFIRSFVIQINCYLNKCHLNAIHQKQTQLSHTTPLIRK